MHNLQRLILKQKKYNFSRYFSKNHEWLEKEQNSDNCFIGITDYAQSKLGKILYIQFPDIENEFNKQEEMSEIGSGEMNEIGSPETLTYLYAPLKLTVLENNRALPIDYTVINKNADQSWFYKVRVHDLAELDQLLEEAEYKEFCDSQE